jgi:hypothetical protein
MGSIRSELFRAIADDAAASLAYFDSLHSTNNTAHFDGAGALQNLKGQLRLFELMMRRAANYCDRRAKPGQPGEPEGGMAHVTLAFDLASGSLAGANAEGHAAGTRIFPSPDDLLATGRMDPKVETLILRLQQEALFSGALSAEGASLPVKRGRGRPRKTVAALPVPATKRGRGRPRKNVVAAATAEPPKTRGRRAKMKAQPAPQRGGRGKKKKQ